MKRPPSWYKTASIAVNVKLCTLQTVRSREIYETVDKFMMLVSLFHYPRVVKVRYDHRIGIKGVRKAYEIKSFNPFMLKLTQDRGQERSVMEDGRDEANTILNKEKCKYS